MLLNQSIITFKSLSDHSRKFYKILRLIFNLLPTQDPTFPPSLNRHVTLSASIVLHFHLKIKSSLRL